jgi:peptidoglycan/xylan/chitin deacetylase (PgdA/CDA1 family)
MDDSGATAEGSTAGSSSDGPAGGQQTADDSGSALTNEASSPGTSDAGSPKPSGDGGSGSTTPPGPSGLPTPPGNANVSRPSGSPGGLTILNWAGFKGATTFTFDDSQPSQIAHYAELAAVGVPMTFYISTGNSTEANYDATWTQAVKDGSEIGNHTVHHCHADLTGCSFGSPLASLPPEVDQCTSYISQHTGQSDVWTGASPFGDTGYDSDAQSRFFVYRGVGGGAIAPNDATNPFDLPCHMAASGETASQFESAIDSAHAGGAWLIILLHSILPTSATWYNPVQITDVTASMTHAKSLGDDWVDTVAAVGAYWRGQKLLSSTTPTTSGGASTWSWTLPAHFPPGKYLRVTVTGGTLTQKGAALPWNSHGYYEVSLDAASLTLVP